MGSNGHSVSKIRPKQGTNIGLKLSGRHCPLGLDFVYWEAYGNSNYKSDIVQVKAGRCPLRGLWKCGFLPKFFQFFPNLILEL
jgi:hypothetical protein